jgi:transposase
MDASTLTPDGPLPDDVPALQALVRQLLGELARLRAENAELRTKLEQALRHRFGQRSERQRPQPKTGSTRRCTPHGRAALPEHLERRTVVHDLTDAERICPCCGQLRAALGEQATEQLDLEPAKFFVRRTIKRTYVCQHCDPDQVPAEQRFCTAGPPEVGPIAKGLCGPGLLAHVVVAKFADHCPLHRLAGQLSRSGVKIADSTLGDWIAAAARLLEPLVGLMHQRLLGCRVLHGDDTGVKQRVPKADRTTRAHLWATIGDADFPYVVFDFTSDYTAAGPEKFLAGYKGYLQADALAQYEGLYGDDKVKHVCCWAHARRKFVTALEAGDSRAQAAVDWIRQLYAIERQLPPLLTPADEPAAQVQRRHREGERQRLRQEQAEPILTRLRQWLQEQTTLLPKSPLAVAVGYARNNWTALGRYTQAGYLAIDNNLSERVLRTVALGRANWGVVGSAAGGERAAVLYSAVGTCKHLGLDPWCYLREALPGLFALGESPKPEQLLAWLPDRWLLTRERAGGSNTSSAG